MIKKLLLSGIFIVVTACEKPSDSRQLLDNVLEAHGGYEQLEAASTWVAEVRRYQRGDSYELRNYYRPGMVRLESDLGNGERSADVIGHPHCWGKNGPMTFPCSAETRENDRPRVVMEMAAQIWPLRGEDWSLLSTSVETVNAVQLDILATHYGPLDSPATLRFRQDTGLLHSISIDGVKGGRSGTHTHVYSKFEERCGVQMPTHNIKSFEGDVWVEEDILQLECIDVDESMFVRPDQVADGFIDERPGDELSLVCSDDADDEMRGMLQRHIAEDGSTMTCTFSAAESQDAGNVVTLPASKQLSIYGLESSPEKLTAMIGALQDEALNRNYNLRWPIRVMTYDNDGMGLTGEIVVEATVAVEEQE